MTNFDPRPSPRLLTKAEAQQRLLEGRSLVTLSSRKHNAFFFSNDHCHSLRVQPNLSSDWVPCSTHIPHNVVARPALPSGIVDSVDTYLAIYDRGMTFLETQEALDACITSYDPGLAKAREDAEAASDPHFNGYDD